MARAAAVDPRRSKIMVLRVLALFLGLGLFVVTASALRTFARERIRNWDRYTTAFADIDCIPPPAQDQEEFLAEVQYLAGMPDRFQILDADLAPRLADAFARHPSVAKVVRITILSPRQVQVQLVYRTPNQRSEVRGRRSEIRSQRSETQCCALTSDF